MRHSPSTHKNYHLSPFPTFNISFQNPLHHLPFFTTTQRNSSVHYALLFSLPATPGIFQVTLLGGNSQTTALIHPIWVLSISLSPFRSSTFTHQPELNFVLSNDNVFTTINIPNINHGAMYSSSRQILSQHSELSPNVVPHLTIHSVPSPRLTPRSLL